MYVCMHAYIRIHVYICMCVCVVCVYIYTYVCIHTYIHTYVYTYIYIMYRHVLTEWTGMLNMIGNRIFLSEIKSQQ